MPCANHQQVRDSRCLETPCWQERVQAYVSTAEGMIRDYRDFLGAHMGVEDHHRYHRILDHFKDHNVESILYGRTATNVSHLWETPMCDVAYALPPAHILLATPTWDKMITMMRGVFQDSFVSLAVFEVGHGRSFYNVNVKYPLPVEIMSEDNQKELGSIGDELQVFFPISCGYRVGEVCWKNLVLPCSGIRKRRMSFNMVPTIKYDQGIKYDQKETKDETTAKEEEAKKPKAE